MIHKENGTVFRQLITLAWPIILAFMMQTGYNLVDIFWVGKLGATAIAAVSLAGNFFYVILALGQIVGSGTVALIAHSYGAGSTGRVNSVAKQSLASALVIALLIGIAGFVFTRQIMYFLGGRDMVLVLSVGYLKIMAAGFFFQLLSFSINYTFRGVGDMKIPMLIMLIATAINLILDPLLILGLGPFPRLEVQGAALATAIANCVSFAVGFAILLRGRSGMKLRIFTPWRFEWATIKKIFSIGIPVGISYGLMATSIMVVFSIVAGFSEHALAALGIGTRIFQFASLPVVGVGVATTTLIGHKLGARDPRGAQQVSRTALKVSISIMAAFVLLFLTMAGTMISLFTRNTQTISHGIHFIQIAVYYLIFVGISTSLTGVYRGAGYTVPPMVAGIIKVVLLYLFAVVLARTLGMGVNGVWWSMLIAYGIESAVLLLWYRRGSWRARGLDLTRGISGGKPLSAPLDRDQAHGDA
ncbi:MATE family efflux transporter [candidate division WOR-3 bacterium]|nr:MATE family efflux transporter [candidate division WOR-3 bacterium]